MAISKETLNNKKKKTNSANMPKPLGCIPENNPNHVSKPINFHHPIPPKPILYNSFEEAKAACELIFLKPGEAHTEFYQKEGEYQYHCVVAIGNIKPDTEHLYLTDSVNEIVNYELIGNKSSDQKYEYVLYETITGEEHGKIIIDPSTGIHTVYWYDGSTQTAEFSKVFRWTGERDEWTSNVESKWKNCLVFGNIIENDETITKCILAGNKEYEYKEGVYWDEPEFEGNERP